MPKDQKGSTQLAIVLAVIIVGIAGFAAWRINRQNKTSVSQTSSNNSTPTSQQDASNSEIPKDWKKYTSKEFGFSFSYPATTEIYEGCNDTCVDHKIPYSYDGVSVSQDNIVLVTIGYIPDFQLSTLTTETVTQNMGPGYGSDLIVKATQIANVAGFKVTIKNNDGSQTYYLKNLKNQVLRINFSDRNDNTIKDIPGEISEKIFQSFSLEN